MTGVRIVAVVMLAATLSACGGDDNGNALFMPDAGATEADYSFTIPGGAGDAIDRGEPLEILPAEMEVHVGEVIQIVNLDDRGHLAGPFYVGAGETLTQRFTSPGEFIGVCTVHPSGELRLLVSES